MKQAALVCVLAALAFGVAGCGGGGDKESEEAANPQAKAACDGSALSGDAEPAGELPDGREHDADEAVDAGPDRGRRGLLERAT